MTGLKTAELLAMAPEQLLKEPQVLQVMKMMETDFRVSFKAVMEEAGDGRRQFPVDLQDDAVALAEILKNHPEKGYDRKFVNEMGIIYNLTGWRKRLAKEGKNVASIVKAFLERRDAMEQELAALGEGLEELEAPEAEAGLTMEEILRRAAQDGEDKIPAAESGEAPKQLKDVLARLSEKGNATNNIRDIQQSSFGIRTQTTAALVRELQAALDGKGGLSSGMKKALCKIYDDIFPDESELFDAAEPVSSSNDADPEAEADETLNEKANGVPKRKSSELKGPALEEAKRVSGNALSALLEGHDLQEVAEKVAEHIDDMHTTAENVRRNLTSSARGKTLIGSGIKDALMEIYDLKAEYFETEGEEGETVTVTKNGAVAVDDDQDRKKDEDEDEEEEEGEGEEDENQEEAAKAAETVTSESEEKTTVAATPTPPPVREVADNGRNGAETIPAPGADTPRKEVDEAKPEPPKSPELNTGPVNVNALTPALSAQALTGTSNQTRFQLAVAMNMQTETGVSDFNLNTNDPRGLEALQAFLNVMNPPNKK